MYKYQRLVKWWNITILEEPASVKIMFDSPCSPITYVKAVLSDAENQTELNEVLKEG